MTLLTRPAEPHVPPFELDYSISIEVSSGSVGSVFGKVTVSTPFRYDASTVSLVY